MKKIKNLPENNFLILFFLLFSLAFLIASLVALDRAFLFEGMEQILTQPCKIPTNYFAVGGYSATFFNMGLVTLACLGLYLIFRAELNNVATLAIMLTVGFASWGIDILNIWPTVFGTMLYCVVKKRTMKNYVSAMLFTTGIAPLISDLLTRYPYETTVGFTPQAAVLAIVVGLVSGFFIPAGLTHAPNVHKGFDLYSAALPIGMTAFLLQTVLYKAPGVALPAAPAGETLQVASAMAANLFCGVVFGLCIVFALLMGAKPKDYWKMLTEKDQVSSVTAAYGNAVFLLNVGLFGLMILGYYDLVGGAFNGITFGIIFCMLATCNSGSNPATVWPILLGYVGGVRPDRRPVCPGHQRPGHSGGPLLCQRPQPHHRQIRLAVRLRRRRGSLLPGNDCAQPPRGLLPLQRRLYGGPDLHPGGAPAGAVRPYEAAAPGSEKAIKFHLRAESSAYRQKNQRRIAKCAADIFLEGAHRDRGGFFSVPSAPASIFTTQAL